MALCQTCGSSPDFRYLEKHNLLFDVPLLYSKNLSELLAKNTQLLADTNNCSQKEF
jgi:hypothetical protein